jgi:hypothetical protein
VQIQYFLPSLPQAVVVVQVKGQTTEPQVVRVVAELMSAQAAQVTLQALHLHRVMMVLAL